MKQTLILFLIIWSSVQLTAQNTVMENLDIAIEFNSKKDYEASLRFCNAALEQAPELSDIWFLRGINNYQLENYKDAIIDFTVAINFRPGYAEAWFYRGKCKQANNNLVGALSDYNKAREIDPGQSASLVVKSIISSIFGKSDKKLKSKN
jgi:tetratricopeptide (TPR) repeat protein